MIITCEKCETKFSFDESRLGIGGRKVRCANCKHVWHVSPPELELAEKKPEPAAPADKVQPKIKSDKNEATAKKAEIAEESDNPKRVSLSLLKVAASVLVVLNFVVFVYFNKGIIGQTAFYDTVGNYDTKAMEIVSTNVTPVASEKGTNLQIAWAVKNTSARTLKMPVVRFRLYDAGLEQIGEIRNERENVKVAAGQEQKFKDSLVHANKKARYFTVEIGNPTELATR